MTQVVTVSAHTAAYVAETLRPSARVSGQSPSDKTAPARAAEARRSAARDEPVSLNAVPAPAVTLFFLTAQKQPNATYERAHEEYLSSLAEYRAEHEELDGERADEADDQG